MRPSQPPTPTTAPGDHVHPTHPHIHSATSYGDPQPPIHPHHTRTLIRQLWQHHPPPPPPELEDNDTKMHATWDPNSPFDCLIKQIDDGQDYTNDGGQPYTAK